MKNMRLAWRLLVRWTLVALMGLVAVLAYLAMVGVPEGLLPRLLRPIGSHLVVMEVEALRWNVLTGCRAEGVKLYARQRIGPPFFEAQHLRVDVDLLGALWGAPVVRAIRAQDGRLKLAMLDVDKSVAGELPVVERPWSLELELRRIDVDGVMFDLARGTITGTPAGIRIEPFHVTYAEGGRGGALQGQAWLRRDLGRADVDMTMTGDPMPMLPLLDARGARTVAKVLRRMEFRDPESRWRVKYSSRDRAGHPARMEGQVWAQNLSYRGVDLLRADGRYTCVWMGTNTLLRFDPLVLVRDEGVALCRLDFDIRQGDSYLSFDSRSGLEPEATARMLGLLAPDTRQGLRVLPPYHIHGTGRMGLNGQDGQVRAKMQFGAVGRGALLIENVRLNFEHVGATNRFTDIRGALHGGVFAGALAFVNSAAGDATTPGEEPRWSYTFEAKVARADFEGLLSTALEDGTSERSGQLAFQIKLAGPYHAAWQQDAVGEGTISIRDGRLFMLPLFGGLTAMLSKAIPGMDIVLNQSHARADFDIRDGYAASQNLRVDGDVFSLRGVGKYFFDRSLDFDVQVTFLRSHTLAGKLIRIPTYLLSKLFEFRLRGTLDHPHWYPLNFSSDLWESSDVLPAVPLTAP